MPHSIFCANFFHRPYPLKLHAFRCLFRGYYTSLPQSLSKDSFISRNRGDYSHKKSRTFSGSGNIRLLLRLPRKGYEAFKLLSIPIIDQFPGLLAFFHRSRRLGRKNSLFRHLSYRSAFGVQITEGTFIFQETAEETPFLLSSQEGDPDFHLYTENIWQIHNPAELRHPSVLFWNPERP